MRTKLFDCAQTAARAARAMKRKARIINVLAVVIAAAGGSFAHEASGVPWAMARFPSGEEFTLELALDDESRAQGYMYREKIAGDEGMLFVFDRPGTHGFWMKNCKIALDIIWLDADFRVVDIAHDRQPCPADGECSTVFPMRAASYVLEVAGGTARRVGLERGSRITVWADPPLPR
jgi:uncharacterized membrane protein (UPF0127 family)